MGLLDNTTQQDYYGANNYGNYQFTSLEDIINQFMVAYVGEEKTIKKVSRTDVAFHAQRAMQELSFDTFKSIKSQEIELPPSLTMRLPHDYVNYTKLSWSDSSGIKHLLYPTSKTSNPFKIKQNSDGEYDFTGEEGAVETLNNADFETALKATTDWSFTPASGSTDIVAAVAGLLTITSVAFNYQNTVTGRAYSVWQEIDVENMDTLDIKADGSAAAAAAGVNEASFIRFGISSTPGDSTTNLLKPPNSRSTNDQTSSTKVSAGQVIGPNFLATTDGGGNNGLGYIEWNGTTSTDEEVFNIDVSSYDTVYALVTCWTPFLSLTANTKTCTLDNISITYDGASPNLVRDGDSTTWTNYKSATPSENQDDYQDDTYWPNNQKRYGLDPQHAQVNGSFYVDNLKGLIHFSSNISGKTVILDYISDSLGTDGEMQVHKFAEEAMYRWIMYAILSTRANVPEYVVRRYQKEKFAATRQAKLRLSNIKLEELTQILRGKSKHIKH